MKRRVSEGPSSEASVMSLRDVVDELSRKVVSAYVCALAAMAALVPAATLAYLLLLTADSIKDVTLVLVVVASTSSSAIASLLLLFALRRLIVVCITLVAQRLPRLERGLEVTPQEVTPQPSPAPRVRKGKVGHPERRAASQTSAHTAQLQAKACPHCGRALPFGDVHMVCPHCGRRLR